MNLGKNKLPEGLNVCINYGFNLLDHVDAVATAGGVRRRSRCRTKWTTNSLGPNGVITLIVEIQEDNVPDNALVPRKCCFNFDQT